MAARKKATSSGASTIEAKVMVANPETGRNRTAARFNTGVSDWKAAIAKVADYLNGSPDAAVKQVSRIQLDSVDVPDKLNL